MAVNYFLKMQKQPPEVLCKKAVLKGTLMEI